MQITSEIPDDFASNLIGNGQEPSRVALQSMAIEGYRRRHLTESQVKRVLGFSTRMQVHALLKEHGVPLDYSMEDLEHDLEVAAKYRRPAASQAA